MHVLRLRCSMHDFYSPLITVSTGIDTVDRFEPRLERNQSHSKSQNLLRWSFVTKAIHVFGDFNFEPKGRMPFGAWLLWTSMIRTSPAGPGWLCCGALGCYLSDCHEILQWFIRLNPLTMYL